MLLRQLTAQVSVPGSSYLVFDIIIVDIQPLVYNAHGGKYRTPGTRAVYASVIITLIFHRV